jgi:hypothetical protein
MSKTLVETIKLLIEQSILPDLKKPGLGGQREVTSSKGVKSNVSDAQSQKMGAAAISKTLGGNYRETAKDVKPKIDVPSPISKPAGTPIVATRPDVPVSTNRPNIQQNAAELARQTAARTAGQKAAISATGPQAGLSSSQVPRSTPRQIGDSGVRKPVAPFRSSLSDTGIRKPVEPYVTQKKDRIFPKSNGPMGTQLGIANRNAATGVDAAKKIQADRDSKREIEVSRAKKVGDAQQSSRALGGFGNTKTPDMATRATALRYASRDGNNPSLAPDRNVALDQPASQSPMAKAIERKDAATDAADAAKRADMRGATGNPNIAPAKIGTSKKLNFKQAYAAARKAGQTGFEWEGKKYNTKMKGETATKRKQVLSRNVTRTAGRKARTGNQLNEMSLKEKVMTLVREKLDGTV